MSPLAVILIVEVRVDMCHFWNVEVAGRPPEKNKEILRCHKRALHFRRNFHFRGLFDFWMECILRRLFVSLSLLSFINLSDPFELYLGIEMHGSQPFKNVWELAFAQRNGVRYSQTFLASALCVISKRRWKIYSHEARVLTVRCYKGRRQHKNKGFGKCCVIWSFAL